MSNYIGSQSFLRRAGDYLSHEYPYPALTRRKITIPASFGDQDPGTVVSVDGTGTAVAFTGAETDLAVLWTGVKDSASTQVAMATWRLSALNESKLVLPTLTAPQRTAMIADFEARMVVLETPVGSVIT